MIVVVGFGMSDEIYMSHLIISVLPCVQLAEKTDQQQYRREYCAIVQYVEQCINIIVPGQVINGLRKRVTGVNTMDPKQQYRVFSGNL